MNWKITYILFFTSLILFAGSCSKDEEEITDDLKYYSLVAEKETIAPGETVIIKANASGGSLKYFWEATPYGDILGSGAKVTYTASPCGVGINKITCTVTNGKQSESKTIDIVVYE